MKHAKKRKGTGEKGQRGGRTVNWNGGRSLIDFSDLKNSPGRGRGKKRRKGYGAEERIERENSKVKKGFQEEGTTIRRLWGERGEKCAQG